MPEWAELQRKAGTMTPIADVDGVVFDAAEAAPHAPDLYAYQRLTETAAGFDSITEAEIERYHRDGFLAIAQGFTEAEMAAAGDGLTDLVMGRYPNFKGIQFERGARARLAQMSLEERQDAVRKLMWFTPVEPRLAALAQHPALLALVERLLGGRPVLFQDMALLKPPRGREKPWHQDKAYFTYSTDTPVVGVWIANGRGERHHRLSLARAADGTQGADPPARAAHPRPRRCIDRRRKRAAMDQASSAAAGQPLPASAAVYSKRILSLYDLSVLGFSNTFVWGCPTRHILKLYDRHVSSEVIGSWYKHARHRPGRPTFVRPQ